MSQEMVAEKNWRQEGNSLDLNNLPEDNNTKDGKKTSLDTSSSAGGGFRKKKSGPEGDGKVYECRFCSLKFCKSQALGGHMNRHRQERETETLNKARQLVFTNDLAPVHLAFNVSNGGEPIPSNGVYHQTENAATRLGPPTPPPLLRPIYPPPRIFSTSPPLISTPPPQPQAVYTYPPDVPHHLFTFQTGKQPANYEYFVGHALSYAPNDEMCNNNNNYTCIGTPVIGLGTENTAVPDREEGLNCDRS